ncbi:Uncharacterised protein [Vibrio cholerae]|nr:Uncharacterised protein [Vibrio cholerae]
MRFARAVQNVLGYLNGIGLAHHTQVFHLGGKFGQILALVCFHKITIYSIANHKAFINVTPMHFFFFNEVKIFAQLLGQLLNNCWPHNSSSRLLICILAIT